MSTPPPPPTHLTPRPLREAHAHIPAHGRAMTMLQLGDCRDRAELLDRLRSQPLSPSTHPAPWLLGVGARVSAWPDPRWPAREELDHAAAGRPCAIMSFDHHCVAANTLALAAANIHDATADPPGGVIGRDPRSGTLTGLLLESAAMQVWHAAPEPTREQTKLHVLAALRALAAHGFVEVHDMLSPAALGPMLAELDAEGQLPMEVWLYAPIAELERQHAAAAAWHSSKVRFAGAKAFADGTLNSRTAWMLSDYRNPLPGLPRGKPMMTPAELDDAIARTHALGVGLAVHAIGDGAVRAVLDARERAGDLSAAANPVPTLRIEHCELIDETDVPRFAALGVVASVQPCHLLCDIEILAQELPHRLDRVLPLRDLICAGCEPGRGLWFGSDVPIVRPDPQDSIQAAVHRTRANAPNVTPIAPSQSVTQEQAWMCFQPTASCE